MPSWALVLGISFAGMWLLLSGWVTLGELLEPKKAWTQRFGSLMTLALVGFGVAACVVAFRTWTGW